MRTIFIVIIILSAILHPTLAQNESEALRFSQNFSGGTARNLSLSGAMGALGGDASSLSSNPAGLGVYRSSEFSLTMGANTSNTTGKYLGTSYDDTKTKFNISNLAYVYTYNTNKSNGFVSASFGVGYNRLNDFNSNVTLIGDKAQSSLLDEFVYYANGIDQDLPFEEQENILRNSTAGDGPLYYYEGLAFKANELIFLNDQNSFYNDFMDFGYDQYQKKSIITKGGIGEVDFSFATNFSNILYLGATLGIQNLNYERLDDHYEEANGDNTELNSFLFSEHFNAYGNGVNFKAGAIVRPIDFLRMGLAYHSPTYFNLESEFYTSVDADFVSRTDKYESTTLSISEYKLKTPSKLIGSFAVVFDKFGLISVDVERTNYTKAHFRSDDYDYVDENSAIKDVYNKGVYNFRVGAEGKLGPFALRAGYAKYGKPYVSNQINSNTRAESLSGGIGVRGKSVFFDIAYVFTTYNEHHKLYTYERTNSNNEFVTYDQLAKINSSNSKIMATLGFRF